jgi:AraC-like DNA-binding protein
MRAGEEIAMGLSRGDTQRGRKREGEQKDPTALRPRFHVWDSQYEPSTKAFSIFREAICSSFMPWTPEALSSHFEGRVESIPLESGVVGRVRMTPIVARKTKSDIARSEGVCIHGNLVISGELKVEQGNKVTIARPGDLALYSSELPTTLTVKSDRSDGLFDNLALVIPVSACEPPLDARGMLLNCVLRKHQMLGPLNSCLNLLLKSLYSSEPEELDSLLKATSALLPLSAKHVNDDPLTADLPCHMLRAILHFIDISIADPNLSPGYVARNFGVSVRYVHKLLAQYGTTFSEHVTVERLKRIKWELDADVNSRVPISVAVHRWGFSDLSTFNRAFKRRFGFAPTDVFKR